MGFIIDILSSTSFVAFIIGILIIQFAKAIIKIFNMGVMFKTNLATKKEQQEFEERIRQDLVNYKEEIQRTVLSVCLRTIDREMRHVDEINKTATELKLSEQSMRAKMEDLNSKYDEVKATTDSVHALTTKVQRLEFGKDISRLERRSEK